MKQLGLFILFILSTAAHAQLFVQHNNGEVYTGQELEYKKPIFEPSYILLDNMFFHPDSVAFFKSPQGLFANTRLLNFSGTTDFAGSSLQGRVNLFRKDYFYYQPGYMTSTTNAVGITSHSHVPAAASGNTKLYYNKNGGPLKKANYANLAIDLADNPASMQYLEKVQQNTVAEVLLMVVGAALLANGINQQAHATEENENRGLGSMVLGALVFNTNFIFESSKVRLKHKAVEAYNKP